MSISIRRSFESEAAKMFLDDIQFQRSRYYYFLGNVEPWSGIGNEGITDTPIDFLNTTEYDRKIRAEMVFAKYIAPNDASLVIHRIEWEAGKHYDKWDHTQDMKEKHFYVINSKNEVYKCLDNPDTLGYDAPSTVEPNIVSIYPFRTSDGYLWKYMYTVAPYAATRFGSVEYMPVKRALSDTFYNNGAIEAAVVLTEGSGYPDLQLTRITVSNATLTGSGAVLSIGSVSSIGAIQTITITNGGSGYTAGVRVKVTSASGGGAELAAVVSGGVITGVNIVAAGVGYSTADVVSASVGGASLVPMISRETGSIVGVKIIDAGVGYDSAPALTVTVAAGQTPGTGKFGNATALLEAVVYQGKIQIVNVKDPGINYPADSRTTISVQGDGEGAEFSPVIVSGRVVDVVIENPGTGYTDIVLTVQSDAGSGATVRGIIGQSDYTSLQSVVEQTSVDGAIYSFSVSAEGSNYSSATYVEIVGNGTGCQALPVIENGRIKAVKVKDSLFGSGYTDVRVNIIDPTRPDDQRTTEQIARAYATLPPVGGHGRDAPNELYCATVAINTPLRDDVVINKIYQDFRTFGIVKNPRSILTGNKYLEQSSILCYLVDVVDASFLVKDTIYKLGEDRYRVVDIDGSSVYLQPLSRNTVIPVGTLINDTNESLQLVTKDLRSSFSMDKYSGRLMYVSTELPFEFSANQSITVKTFITF